MSDIALPAVRRRTDTPVWLRGGLFVGILGLATVTLSPFPNLGNAAILDVPTGNEAGTYAMVALLVMATAATLGQRLRHVLPCLASPTLIALGLWLIVSCGLSADPAASARRLVLTAMTMTLGACLFLLPRDREELARFLAAFALIVLALCYYGVAFMPGLAIHQASDVLEPQLAGDWRGTFAQKNGAAAYFALSVFIGLFVSTTRLHVVGTAIALASVVFMLFAGGKSAMMLVVVTLLVVAAWDVLPWPSLRIGLALLPLAFLLALGIGGVFVPELADLADHLPLDTTFTGRTDIWSFAADQLRGHWVQGFGFQAFWNSEAIRFGADDATWAATAPDAHNGYLDAVIDAGLPGLALAVASFVILPLRDAFAAARRGADPALRRMLMRIVFFCLYLSAMETVFFDRFTAVWVLFLFAFFGLRYAAHHRLKGSRA